MYRGHHLKCGSVFRGIGFSLQKIQWLAGQYVGTGITWSSVMDLFIDAVGMLSWLVLQVGIKLERTVLLHEYIQCPALLLLVKIFPLPSIGRTCGCESCVYKAKVQPLFCWAKWWVFSIEASHNEITSSPLNTKPASLCNACSFLFYVWPTGSCLAWPKDVKSLA